MRLPTSIAALLPSIIAVADATDTALLVTDTRALLHQLDLLSEVFPAGTRHAVAIKTNPHRDILSRILAHGFDLEAASIEEVQLAIEVGAQPDRIVFDSPVKTRAEINQCSACSGMQVNANMLSELQRYPDSIECQLGLRINPGIDTGSPDMYAVSTDESKFGIPLADEAQILRACLNYPVKTLHMHSGSQMSNLDIQLQAIRKLFELADAIDQHRSEHGNTLRIDTINIGGGLPAEREPDQPAMRQYAAAVSELANHHKGRQLRTEFGQWTHRSAGYALTRVEYVGDGPVSNIFVHLGADLFTRHTYAPAKALDLLALNADGTAKTGDQQHYNVAGPLCFAGDYLAHKIKLPQVNEGDWLLISEAGANTYGLWSRHCSRSIPKVLAIEADGAITQCSERKTVDY